MYYENPQGVSIHNGFPNAAADVSLQSLDLNKLLISNKIGTYLMRISGNNWQAIGIFDDDIAIIDRTLNPSANDLVIWVHDDQFAISPRHKLPQDGQAWGVVTSVIHQYRNRK